MELLSILYPVINKVRSLIKEGLKTDNDLTDHINKLKGIGE